MNIFKKLLFASLMTPLFPVVSQTGWTWQVMADMPEPVTNNALTHGEQNGSRFVYSFAGLDSTKLYSGIHLKSFRYDVVNNLWDTLPNLPDTLGKIAAAASTVKNKIYIIGGYHVFANGNEVSSNKVHRFDPETNSFLTDGTNCPHSIDDHVQCVWRDSLIYVITGWSNSGNVPYVDIYNPSTDTWLTGASTPNTNYFKAFGASGVIVGDTIFYAGGVTGSFSFVATSFLRKGIINPNDPTQITWTQETDNPGDNGYRMAACNYNDRCFWIGGAGTAYNYNGIAYNGSGGVEPLPRILTYQSSWQMWFEGLGAPYGVMDLRGIANVSPTQWIIAGGMLPSQVVSDKTYLLTFDPIAGKINEKSSSLKLYPNPSNGQLVLPDEFINAKVFVYDMTGRFVKQIVANSDSIDLKLPVGEYILNVYSENSVLKPFVQHQIIQ